ncbi:hypothetical protein D9M68_552050 [compost metagenome]
MVGLDNVPAVLVQVEAALGIDMTRASFQGCFDHPYPVRLITHQILIHVFLADDLLVFQGAVMELVVVIGNQHFLLADQLPVVLVRGTVVHVHAIHGA